VAQICLPRGEYQSSNLRLDVRQYVDVSLLQDMCQIDNCRLTNSAIA